MSKKCIISGKGPLSGNKRSHAMNATKRKWNINLQKAKIKINGIETKIQVSTRALRTLKKKSKITN